MKLEYLLIPTDATPAYSMQIFKNYKIKQQKPNLTDRERESIYSQLSQYSVNGKLPRGLLGEISSQFGVKPRTISRIWHQGQESIRQGFKSANVCSRIKFNSGRKKSYTGSVIKLYQDNLSLKKCRDYNNLYIN
jgi:hypothetical protein